ncbi:MAG TPA: YetF domain-containing protein [Ramlibacter sp.]|nr:YetF domain-containing protein [Ramlibacter sp.]
MFELQIPWWEFIVRASIVYIALLAMVRLTGKRTVGQFTPFDLVVVMLLAEAVSDSLRGGDESLVGGLIAAATLVVLDVLIAIATARSAKVDNVLQGTPVVIGRDGVIYKDVLKRQRVPEADVEKALRTADCQIEDMRMAILEADGDISILKRGA